MISAWSSGTSPWRFAKDCIARFAAAMGASLAAKASLRTGGHGNGIPVFPVSCPSDGSDRKRKLPPIGSGSQPRNLQVKMRRFIGPYTPCVSIPIVSTPQTRNPFRRPK